MFGVKKILQKLATSNTGVLLNSVVAPSYKQNYILQTLSHLFAILKLFLVRKLNFAGYFSINCQNFSIENIYFLPDSLKLIVLHRFLKQKFF